ncbi:MAG TPA: TonB-dependent receptor, partial [Chitinophagales bacterium]|nr:TonB-dependent receptor [Chitinophagales bacterium]
MEFYTNGKPSNLTLPSHCFIIFTAMAQRLLFSLLFFVSTVSYTTAQSSGTAISGHVTARGRNLEAASVSLSKTQLSTLTDSLGNFRLNNVPPGKYTLRISYIGYENFENGINMQTAAPLVINAMLKPLVSDMDEIVVTGDLTEATRAKSITPIDVYSTTFLQRSPVTNVFDAMAYAKGIYSDIDQGISNTTDINVNGLEGNYTMFLIDGVPALNNLAGLYALTAFPISIVDKIEVEKGASSTLYGSDAIAGVVNIKTKDPAEAPCLAINATSLSKLESEAGLSAAFKLKKASTLLSVSGEAADYRWDINHDGFIDAPLVNRANFYNKWSFDRANKRTAIIYARYLFEDRFTGQADAPGRITGSLDYYTQWIRTHQWQAGFQYQLPVREKFMWLTDYSEHYQQAWFDTSHYVGNQRNLFTQLTWSKTIAQKHEMLAGVSYRLRYYHDNTGLSDVALTGASNFCHIAGIFFEDRITVNNQNQVSAGLRFDYNNLSGPIAVPRINYRWNSTDEKNIIRLGAGTGYRVPNLLNEGFGVLQGSRQVSVPEKLKTEYATSLDMNYSRRILFNAGALSLETGIFGTYLVNFVEPDYDTDPSLVIYKNHQGGGTFGANFSADFAFRFPLKLGVNCTYNFVFELDHEDDGDLEFEEPTHSPPFMANYYLAYTFNKAM